jgi:hypothetical protein
VLLTPATFAENWTELPAEMLEVVGVMLMVGVTLADTETVADALTDRFDIDVAVTCAVNGADTLDGAV